MGGHLVAKRDFSAGYTRSSRIDASAPICRSNKLSTTLSCDRRSQVFLITHPFHPLCGQEFELIDRRLTWGEDRVYYYAAGNHLKSLPASYSNVQGADPFVLIANGRAYFRIDDLIELAHCLGKRSHE